MIQIKPKHHGGEKLDEPKNSDNTDRHHRGGVGHGDRHSLSAKCDPSPVNLLRVTIDSDASGGSAGG